MFFKSFSLVISVPMEANCANSFCKGHLLKSEVYSYTFKVLSLERLVMDVYFLSFFKSICNCSLD
jgi:hypothetical protein